MADFKISFTTTQNSVSEDLQKRIREMPRAVAAGSYMLGNVIMTEAKRRTPADTGTLRGSGYVENPVMSGNTAKTTLGFGGAAKAYAVVQHERLDFKHPNGGEAKFLENAITAYEGRGTDIFVAAMEKCLAANGAIPAGVHQTSATGGVGAKSKPKHKSRTGRHR